MVSISGQNNDNILRLQFIIILGIYTSFFVLLFNRIIGVLKIVAWRHENELRSNTKRYTAGSQVKYQLPYII